MAARSTKRGPRKGGPGDNSLTMKEQDSLAKKMLENIKLHNLKNEAFKSKQKKNWETNVSAIAKMLHMTQGDVMAYFEDHAIETSDDKDAVKKAQDKRARRLATYSRLYAATHDGEQLDLLEEQKKADLAVKEAEEAADRADVEEDGGDED